MAKNKGMVRVSSINELMRTHDVQEIINLARPIFGNPLILSNGSYTVMAITEEKGIDDPKWTEITVTRGVPMGVVTNSSVNETYRRSLETQRPVLDQNAEGVNMLRKVLSTGERILGYLDSPLYMQEIEEDDIEFFDFLGNLLSMELQKNSEQACLPDNMLDYFVFDLLEGHMVDRKLINERLEFFQWNLFAKGSVQIVSIRGKYQELETDNIRFRQLLEKLSKTFPNDRSFAYMNQLKMLCPVSDCLQKDERFMEQLEAMLISEELVAGISRPLIEIESISDFNRQSERAAELGRRFHPKQSIHLYDSYAIYHALELVADRERMAQFCHSAVILLRDYDRAHETDLLESLRIYLTHDRSIGESAAALYIHRNTMNYRITRINELTSLDMSDPDVFCHLLFSFYALDYEAMQQEDETVQTLS